MVKIANIANAEIKNAFQSVSALVEEDYALLEKVIPQIKSPNLIYPFMDFDEQVMFDKLLEGFVAKHEKDETAIETKKAKKMLSDEITAVCSDNINIAHDDRIGAMVYLASKYNVQFARFEIILGKLSDQYSPSAYASKKTGKNFYRIPLVAGDSVFTSFITNDEQESTEFEGHMGCRIAIVGNWVPNDYTDKEGNQKHSMQIKNYRGSMILEESSVGADLDEPEEL